MQTYSSVRSLQSLVCKNVMLYTVSTDIKLSSVVYKLNLNIFTPPIKLYQIFQSALINLKVGYSVYKLNHFLTYTVYFLKLKGGGKNEKVDSKGQKVSQEIGR